MRCKFILGLFLLFSSCAWNHSPYRPMNYNSQQLTYSIDHPISVTIVQYKNEPPMIVIIDHDKRIVVKDSLILQYDKP